MNDEYIRRNLLHRNAVEAWADIGAVIDRLCTRGTAPKWLITILDRAHNKAYDVSKEMARHRDEVKP